MATKTFEHRGRNPADAVRNLMTTLVIFLNYRLHPIEREGVHLKLDVVRSDMEHPHRVECSITWTECPWVQPHFGVWEFIVAEGMDLGAAAARGTRFVEAVGFPENRINGQYTFEDIDGAGRALWVALLFRPNLHGIRVGPDSVRAGLMAMDPGQQRSKLERELEPLLDAFDAALRSEHPDWAELDPVHAATILPMGRTIELRHDIMRWANENSVERADPALLEG